MLTLASLPHAVQTGDIDTVIVAFPDLQGRPVGKRYTGEFFLESVLKDGMEACDYLFACDVDMNPLPGYQFANWDAGFGDVVARVDPATIRPLPWLPGTAMVLCDVEDRHGAPVEGSPRQILRRQIERAAAMGFEIKCATELEFYLFRESFEEAAARNWQNLTPHASTIEDYQLLQTSRDEYIIGAIRRQMVEAGIPIESSKGEAGIGQHEVNITYSTPLEVADRHLVLKNGVKEIAQSHGRSATFMAKWHMDQAGSSCHLHTSVWDQGGGRSLMAPDEGTTTDSGLSPIGQHFLAGQIAGARPLAWCFAPYLNSYRRYIPDSWAPTAVVWGDDNRTCGFRAVGHGSGRRVECRIPGSDVNPYIALAAAIASGLYGIEHELPLETGFQGNAYVATDIPRIPSTLPEAIGLLAESELATEVFGAEVHAPLLNTALQEWETGNRVITDWEFARNFERI